MPVDRVDDYNRQAADAYNDYLRAYQDRLEALLASNPNLARQLFSRSSSGTFSNVSTERPDISPEMQPLVNEILGGLMERYGRGAESGSYLPEGFEEQGLENLAVANAAEQARFEETAGAMPGGYILSKDPANPFAASGARSRLDFQAALPGLEENARGQLRDAYGTAYNQYGRTQRNVERGSFSNQSTEDRPQDPGSLLAFLSPQGPEATYSGPSPTGWGQGADLVRMLSNFDWGSLRR